MSEQPGAARDAGWMKEGVSPLRRLHLASDKTTQFLEVYCRLPGWLAAGHTTREESEYERKGKVGDREMEKQSPFPELLTANPQRALAV